MSALDIFLIVDIVNAVRTKSVSKKFVWNPYQKLNTFLNHVMNHISSMNINHYKCSKSGPVLLWQLATD